MLESISIKNFSIIKDIEIDFHPGLNVIYGESGSGKSLILYAISVIFGESFNSSLIREGETRSILTCNTTENSYQRVGSKNNNLSSIDGINVPLKLIKVVKDNILQIHSQGDQEELYSKGFQLNYIDEFINTDLKSLVSESYESYKSTLDDMSLFKEFYIKESKQQEFYKYQLEEINKLKPFSETEEDVLNETLKDIILKEKNIENLKVFKDYLNSVSNSYLNLRSLWDKIKDIPDFKNISLDLDDYVFKTLSYTIDSLLDSKDDSFDSDSINNRIYGLQKLRKKLGCSSLKEVIELENKISMEINNIENYPELLEEKKKQLDALEKSYIYNSDILSNERKRICEEIISPILIQNLTFLGFDHVELNVKYSKKSQYSSNGLDDIEFEISFNKGFSPSPIRKIVSGGEASRISLALKILKNDGKTLILDEIETGLSGETLKKLAESLKRVSKDSQIICISHSEDIIGYADRKIKVFKEENKQESKIETKVYQI